MKANLPIINIQSDSTLPGAYIGNVSGTDTDAVSLKINKLLLSLAEGTTDKGFKKLLIKCQDELLNIDVPPTVQIWQNYLAKVKEFVGQSTGIDTGDIQDLIDSLTKIVESSEFISSKEWNDLINDVEQMKIKFTTPQLQKSFPNIKNYFDQVSSLLSQYPKLSYTGLDEIVNKVRALNNLVVKVGRFNVVFYDFDYKNTVLNRILDFQHFIAVKTLADNAAELSALAAAKAQAEADRAAFEAQTAAEKAIADEAQKQADIAAAAATAAANEATNAAAAQTAAEAQAAANNATAHANTAVAASGTIKTINRPITDPRQRPTPTPTRTNDTAPAQPTTPQTQTTPTNTKPNYLLIGGAALAAILLLRR